jgi:nitrogen PTS system EIIA component
LATFYGILFDTDGKLRKMMENEVLTLEEVAGILRVSERTVTDWATRGELPGGKLGTSWRFRRTEIDRWLNTKLSPRISPVSDENRPLEALLSPARIALLSAESKGDALNALIDLCVDVPGVKSREELSESVFAREKLMSTGIGLGIAAPHARLNGLADIYVSVGVNKTPLEDYDALDQQPVRIIVMIIAGRDQHARYIKTLARISRLLRDEQVRAHVLDAKTREEVFAVLTSGAA